MPIQAGPAFEGISEKQNTSQFVSSTVFRDTSTITKAKIILPSARIPDGCNAYLSADGSTFESVTWNEWHTFTTTGTALKYKLEGLEGSELKIENAYGRSIPIKIEYTT